MRARFPMWVVVLVMLCRSAPSGADSSAGVATPAPGVGPERAAARPKLAASPFSVETARLIEVERVQIGEIVARLRLTTDARATLEGQRQIASVKRGTEAALFRLQARFAREAGRSELADRLEAAALEMTRAAERRAADARTARSGR